MIKVLFGKDFFKEPYAEDELELPTELTVGGADFVLLWTSESDLVEIEDGVATFTTPDEDTTVILSAVLAVEIVDAQAEPKAFDVEIVLEGKVSKLYGLVKDYSETDVLPVGFEKDLKELVESFNKDLLKDYAYAIADRVNPVKTLAELEEIIAEVDTEHAGELKKFNEAVADYFAAAKKSEKDTARQDILSEAAGLGLQWFVDDAQIDIFDDVYLPALKDKQFKSLADLQEFVNEQNLAHLEELISKAERDIVADELYEAADNFLDALALDTEDAEEFVGRLELVKTIEAIVTAEETRIVDALNTYDEELLVFAEFKAEYVDAFKVEDDEKVTIEIDIAGIVDAVNKAELKKAIEEVVESAEEEEESFMDALNALKEIAVIEDEDLAAENWNIVDDNKGVYKEAIADADPDTAKEIYDIVAYENLLAAINDPEGAQLQQIIQDELMIVAFNDLKEAQKKEIVKALVVKKGKDGNPVLYASVDDFKDAVEEIIPVYLELLDDINGVTSKSELYDVVEELGRIGVEYGVFTAADVTDHLDRDLVNQFYDDIFEDRKPEEKYNTIQELFDAYNDWLPDAVS